MGKKLLLLLREAASTNSWIGIFWEFVTTKNWEDLTTSNWEDT